MYEDENSEGTSSESETNKNGSTRSKRKRGKTKEVDKIRVTWVEAAEMVRQTSFRIIIVYL